MWCACGVTLAHVPLNFHESGFRDAKTRLLRDVPLFSRRTNADVDLRNALAKTLQMRRAAASLGPQTLLRGTVDTLEDGGLVMSARWDVYLTSRVNVWIRSDANFHYGHARNRNSFALKLVFNSSELFRLLEVGFNGFVLFIGYLLTRVEGKIGSPEKPLSDLGLISYRSYWKDVLLQYLCAHPGSTLSIRDLSQEMAINSYDIVSTLQALGMMKYWKGKHIILKKQVSVALY